MSGDDGPAGSGYGYLGPVEPVEPHEPVAAAERAGWSGAEAVGGRDRRPGLFGVTERQVMPIAAVLLLAVMLVLVRRDSPLPEPASHSPPPYPYLVAHLVYLGPVGAPPGPGEPFTVRLRAGNDGPVPYQLVEVRQSYPGLTVRVVGGLPRSVPAHGGAELAVEYRVTDCAGAPPDAGMPFLDVTLRNTRAIQTVSQILGDRYARDLSTRLHQACPGSGIRSHPSGETTPDGFVR